MSERTSDTEDSQKGAEDGSDKHDNGEPAEQRAKTLRRELDVLLGELKTRGKRAFDVKYQLQQHPAVVAGAGALVLAAVGLGIAQAVKRQRRRHSVKARLAALSALVQERAAAGLTAARTGKASRKVRKQQGADSSNQLVKAAIAIVLPRLLPMLISKLMDGRKQVARTRSLDLPVAARRPSSSAGL